MVLYQMKKNLIIVLYLYRLFENPLSDQDYEELCTSISPYSDSNCFGVDLYTQVVDFVCQKLIINP